MMLTKPSRTVRKLEKRQRFLTRRKQERNHKAEVRRRDKWCRFPLCGCRTLGLSLQARPEVSHSRHKGAGGDPSGERSRPELMVLLCLHRHQDGAVSIHKGTLRAKYLTAAKFNGPIAWKVDLSTGEYPRERGKVWIEVARERAVQEWEPFTAQQRELLAYLAGMEL